MTKLYPLNDRVVIRPDKEEAEKISAGGIIIPTIHKERPTTGTVIAIAENVAIPIVEGQKVLFGKYAGTDILLDEVLMTIIREDDILAVVEET